VLLASLLAGAGCTPHAVGGVEPAKARAEIAAAERHYGEAVRQPVDSLVNCFTQDGQMLQPGMAALRGRDAIRAFLEPLKGMAMVESASLNPEAVEVHGNTAYDWGTYAQRAIIGDKPAQDFLGRYVIEWRREADGLWRIARILVQPG
jgi:uncharacterized protein (TIGR02246 family)